jgi:hypothetical protein
MIIFSPHNAGAVGKKSEHMPPPPTSIASMAQYVQHRLAAAREGRRRVLVIPIPREVRRNAPNWILLPSGVLCDDFTGAPVPLSDIGVRLAQTKNGVPRIRDIVLYSEALTSFPVLQKTIQGIKKGDQPLFREIQNGPADAIVFIQFDSFEPVFWWRVISVCCQ